MNQLPEEAYAQVRSKLFKAGEVLCNGDSLLDRILFICEGSAQAFQLNNKNEKNNVSLVQSGTILGLQELIYSEPCWNYSVEALEDCQVMVLDAEVFMASLMNLPGVLNQVLLHTIKREQSVQRQLVAAFEAKDLD